MKCPRCRTVELQAAQTQDRLTDVDFCPACKGLWFDASELEATLGGERRLESVPPYARPGQPADCPRCRVALFEFACPGTDVLVDGCRKCQGIWLDRGEWPRIKAARTRAPEITCPKCQTRQPASSTCARCGVIYEKYRERQQALSDEKQARAQRREAVFGGARSYKIRQRAEWLEILSPFEISNRYEVVVWSDQLHFGQVREHSRSMLNTVLRQFLGAWRPAELLFEDEDGQAILGMRKPLRFYFHRIELADANGEPLGSVQRRFHLLRPVYDVDDASGRTRISIRGPWIFMPFTDQLFRFMRDGKEVGGVKKRWRRFLREYFTDADAYSSTLHASLSTEERVLLFGAVFLIDFGNYENNERGRLLDFDLFD